MRLLFSTRCSYGHLYPMMPLAEAARAAGHHVAFAIGEAFVPKIRALGYAAYPAGIAVREAAAVVISSGTSPIGPDGRTNMEFGARVFADVAAHATATDVRPLLDVVEPDLVVYGQFDVGAGVAAHAAGVPTICHAISPLFPDEIRQALFAPRLERLWAEHGVTSPPFDAFVGEHHLAIFPTCFELPSFLGHPARQPMRPVPWSEPGAAVPTWVDDERGRPLVYATLGTVVATDDALRLVIEGVASLDADVLVATGSAEGADLGPLPDNVHVEAFVDQARLMPSVDLVVHHGGSGTVLAALAGGVSQVLVPRGADQFLNADLVAGAGLGAVLMPAETTADAIATAAKAALGEPDRRALLAARTEIEAMPHPAEIIAAIAERYGSG